MYSIVASDLDGTLLNAEHKVSSYTKACLHELTTKKNIHFVFATGRHYLDVQQIRQQLGLNSTMITSNGARIHDQQGNLLFKDNISPEVAEYLISFLQHDTQICTNIYQEKSWLSNHAWENYETFFPHSDFSYALFQPAQVDLTDIVKVFFTAPSTELLLPYEIALNKRYGKAVNISFSTPTCLEVTQGGVSKGTAIAKIAQYLGSNLEQCIAFGDGMNDVEMLSMVGKGCIMENGQTRLKQALPHLEIIGTNTADAVAHYLKKLYA